MDRPDSEEFINCSLLQFTRSYKVDKNKIQSVKKRNKDVVVLIMPYLHPDPESEHYQDYCKYKLMLHVPFRSVNELKMDFDSWSEAYEASNLENMTSELIGKKQPKPKSDSADEDSAEDEDSQASNHDEVPEWAILCRKHEATKVQVSIS